MAISKFLTLLLLQASLVATSCGVRLVEKSPITTPRVMAIDVLAVKGGEAVTVSGKYLKDGVIAKLEETVIEVIVFDSKTATFLLPSELPKGVLNLTFFFQDRLLASFPLVNEKNIDGLPTLAVPAELICDDTLFKTTDGDLAKGYRKCDEELVICDKSNQLECLANEDFPGAEIKGLAEKIAVGSEVLGVSGTAPLRPVECLTDGDVNCTIPSNGSIKAAAVQDLLPQNIRLNITVGGILGTMSPDICTSEGQTNCTSTPEFPAVDPVNSILANASKIRSSVSLLGTTGLLSDCSIDGATNCVVVGPSYAAAKIMGSSSKILSGQTIAGILGTAPIRPTDCAIDGDTQCVTTAIFPAVNKAYLSSNASQFSTNVSIAGVSGSLASCSADGAISCIAVSDFPAIDKNLLSANADKFRSSLNIASVAGSLANCAMDGSTSCFVSGSFSAINKSTAAPKIPSGQTLAGVSGTGASKPSDCSTDGGLGCTSVSNFPAIDASSAASKILSGQTVATVAGTAPPVPASCSSDGALDCVTTASFPSADKVSIENLKSKFSNSLSIAGINGTMNVCSSDGQTGCEVQGPNFAAAFLIGAEAKITAGKTLAGVSGSAPVTPLDCATDGATSCVTTANFRALDGASSPPKIVQGQLLAGIPGTATGSRPANCSSDAQTECVSTPIPGFPAMQVAGAVSKIANGTTLGGVVGTAPARPADCGSDGDTGCVAVSLFPAIDKAAVTANSGKFRSTLTIGSVTGSLPTCASDGAVGCYTETNYPSVRVLGLAAKVAGGRTLAGVAGTGAGMLPDCTSDGATGCTANNGFVALSKALVQTNANKIRTSLSLLGVSGTLADCALDGGSNCVTTTDFPAAEKSGAANKLLNGQTLAGVIGTTPLKPADCSSDGGLDCVTVANFPAVDKSALTTAAPTIRNTLSLAGVTGTLVNCTNDGQGTCFASGVYKAADTTNAASKILSGQTLAGVAGTAPVRPNNCSVDGETSCVTVSNYPSVDHTALISQAGGIRSNVTLAGVPGTMSECSSDGATSCRAIAPYPAAQKTGASAKILIGQTLAGVSGVAPIRPADCSATNQTACVSTSIYPSIDNTNLTNNLSKILSTLTINGSVGTMPTCSTDNATACYTTSANPSVVKANVTEGIIKSGELIAGTTGVYPNSTYPLPADAHDDLTTATFAAKVLSSSTFGWFDRYGSRYTATGDTDINSAKILSGNTIFGTAGSLTTVTNCGVDAEVGCGVKTPWKTVNFPNLNVFKFRSGVGLAGIMGLITSRSNYAALTTFNRSSGTGGYSTLDFFDTIDDSNGKGAGATYPLSAPPGTKNWGLWQNFWNMEQPWDTGAGGGVANNGTCDGTEDCVFLDKQTGLRWWKRDTTLRTWENAISACSTYSGWRLPTQKEASQAYINGISNVFRTQSRFTLPTANGSVWTATSRSTDGNRAWFIDFHDGTLAYWEKTNTIYTYCVSNL